MATLWLMLDGQQIACQCSTLEEAYFKGAALFVKPLPYEQLISLTTVKSIITIGMDVDFNVRVYLGHWYPPDKTDWQPEWITFITPKELVTHERYQEQLKKIKEYRNQVKYSKNPFEHDNRPFNFRY
jgi:hypothetical protein